LKQHFKKWSVLFGIAGFGAVVAAIFVLPQYLKPDLDTGITYYPTEGCAPFDAQCIGQKGNQTITVDLRDEVPLWQDSWHYLIFNQLGGSGVDSASLFRRT